VLVATPALVRDFSPQLGRASAMGFWALGPVLGSLLVTGVSSLTLPINPDWRFQSVTCGRLPGVMLAADQSNRHGHWTAIAALPTLPSRPLRGGVRVVRDSRERDGNTATGTGPHAGRAGAPGPRPEALAG
jgi:MFS family permease